MTINQDDLLLEKLIYRFEATKDECQPKNLFKLVNYLRFHQNEKFEVLAQRLLLILYLNYLVLNNDFKPIFFKNRLIQAKDFDFEAFNVYYENIKKDAEYVIQMLSHGHIDLRRKEFRTMFNLALSYINGGQKHILAVTCFIYVYQRKEIAL